MKTRRLFKIGKGSVALSILLSFCITFFLVIPSFKALYDRDNILSLYFSDDVFDFQIPSPSKAQISELEDTSFITEVDAFWETSIELSSSRKTAESRMYVLDSPDLHNFGPFLESRCLQRGSGNAFISNSLASKLNVTIEDSVKFYVDQMQIEVVIAGIFEDLGSSEPQYLIGVSSESFPMNETVAYSGAFVYANDHGTTKKYLDTEYKPLGKLGLLEDYGSKREFEAHKEAIINNNYALEILDMKERGKIEISEIWEPSLSYIFIGLGVLLIDLINIVIGYVSVKNEKSVSSEKIKQLGISKKQLRNNIAYVFNKLIIISSIVFLVFALLYSFFVLDILTMLVFVAFVVLLVIGFVFSRPLITSIVKRVLD